MCSGMERAFLTVGAADFLNQGQITSESSISLALLMNFLAAAIMVLSASSQKVGRRDEDHSGVGNGGSFASCKL
jgi:hypothetical protein